MDFVQRWSDFWAQPDPAGVHTIAHPDIVMTWPAVDEPLRGLPVWEARIVGMLRRFPDLVLTVTGHAFNGDLCFISWRANATVGGRPATWEGIDRMILRDDRVIESLVAFDTHDLRGAAA
ncbi:nuclear transport factor 2 family protein [Longispora sp. K20-0274]|uniref:nuclear transport factor 2 family protein n=1 Tax=Longispora sp. K20-0274 TaxID=3088255 RepID=UPI00399AE7CC